MASGCVPGSGGRQAGSGHTSSKSLFNQVHSRFTTKAGIRYGLHDSVSLTLSLP